MLEFELELRPILLLDDSFSIEEVLDQCPGLARAVAKSMTDALPNIPGDVTYDTSETLLDVVVQGEDGIRAYFLYSINGHAYCKRLVDISIELRTAVFTSKLPATTSKRLSCGEGDLTDRLTGLLGSLAKNLYRNYIR